MRRILCRILLAVAVLIPVATATVVYEPSPEPVGAQVTTYKRWDRWLGGMYHNWFMRAEQVEDGLMILNAWRCSYSDPYNFSNCIHEISTSARSFVCWREYGGGHNALPGKIQIVPNGLNAGGSCDASQVDGQPHPTLGYCFGDDAAYTVRYGYSATGYLGHEDGFTCPYDYPTGNFAYGPWAPLDTTYDPRYTSGYHTFFLY